MSKKYGLNHYPKREAIIYVISRPGQALIKAEMHPKNRSKMS